MTTMKIEFQRKIGIKRESIELHFPGPNPQRQAYEYAVKNLKAARINSIIDQDTGEKCDLREIVEAWETREAVLRTRAAQADQAIADQEAEDLRAGERARIAALAAQEAEAKAIASQEAAEQAAAAQAAQVNQEAVDQQEADREYWAEQDKKAAAERKADEEAQEALGDVQEPDPDAAADQAAADQAEKEAADAKTKTKTKTKK